MGAACFFVPGGLPLMMLIADSIGGPEPAAAVR
jgi:hypothetical protein